MMEWSVVCGILTATYGDHLAATYDTWRKETLAARRQEGAGPTVYTSEVGPDQWSRGAAPTLGECALDIRKGNGAPRITGIRVAPRSFDVHAYNSKRCGNIQAATHEGAKSRKIANDFYRSTNTSVRAHHSYAEKEDARDRRMAKQAEIDAKTN